MWASGRVGGKGCAWVGGTAPEGAAQSTLGMFLRSPTLQGSQCVGHKVQSLPTCCVPADISHLLPFRSLPYPLSLATQPLCWCWDGPSLGAGPLAFTPGVPSAYSLVPRHHGSIWPFRSQLKCHLLRDAPPQHYLCTCLTLFLPHSALELSLCAIVGLPQWRVRAICALLYLAHPRVPAAVLSALIHISVNE